MLYFVEWSIWHKWATEKFENLVGNNLAYKQIYSPENYVDIANSLERK